MGIKKLNNLKKRLRETKDDRIMSSDTDSNESFSDLNESNDSVHLGPELLPHLMDTVFSPQFAKNSHVFTAFCKTSGLFMVSFCCLFDLFKNCLSMSFLNIFL